MKDRERGELNEDVVVRKTSSVFRLLPVVGGGLQRSDLELLCLDFPGRS